MKRTLGGKTFRQRMDEILQEMNEYEAKANQKRFKDNRAAGKKYYNVEGLDASGKLFWLLPEQAELRSKEEGVTVVESKIDYHDDEWECGKPWKQGTIADIERLLDQNVSIVLHNC